MTASNAVQAPACSKPVTALYQFNKIGYNTFLYTSPSHDPKSPLILFFSWNAAAAKHIAKYAVGHQQLFPDCQILLIRGNTLDFFRREAAYRKLNAPALEVVKEHVKYGGEILVHSFSNGGANQLSHFAKSYKQATGTVLPMRAQVLDCSPGIGGYVVSHRAIVLGLPKTILFRLFGEIVIHVFLVAIWLTRTLTGRRNPMLPLRERLNDPNLLDQRAPRVYLYSKEDELVPPGEVDDHAKEAEEKGWKVRKVLFQTSPHCGLLKEDAEGYWSAVMDVWNSPRAGQPQN
ncbi:hypothetical protein GQ43DRAFT_443043 [Delitschia confertaspora ATCC 74209]|uniref:Indole-diterpene biosynthesis protein PaxU n=1 Tax=Delitschia confertaspora ATCC 74209 TaxID=1513339 RepID=A0A9P4JIA5_9PLEO|nr:hypothetical protein GQ43DRAFT_443043 [Delitschia confertaspora ATCC 74209]